MAQFDTDKYFADRASAAPAGFANLSREKRHALEVASRDKETQMLRDHYQKTVAAEEANRESWVSQLGLDEESAAGFATNLAAQGVDGAVRLVKNIGAGIHDVRAAAVDQHIPDQAKEAYQRMRTGQAQPGDEALLGMAAGRTEIPDPRTETAIQRRRREGAETNLQRIERMESALGDARAVREQLDTSSIVHRGNTSRLEDSLKGTYKDNSSQIEQGWEAAKNGEALSGAGDVVSGVAGLLMGIGKAAVTNPKGAAEYVMNNAPQFAMAAGGAAGMALSNIPYAVNAFGEGIAEYQKKNNGALPPDAEMQRMAGLAATLAIAETVGDKLVLGGFGKAGRGAAGAGAEPAGRATLKAALSAAADTAPARVVGAGLRAGQGEFLTEAYQTFGENEIKREDTTLEDVYIGGSIGAIAGAGTGAGVQGLREAGEGAVKVVDEAARRVGERVALNEAVKSGDASPYLDPAKPTYSPAKAVQVLAATSMSEEATPEQRTASRKQATEIVTELDTRRESLAQELALLTPEGVQGQIQAQEVLLAEMDPASPKVAVVQEMISILNEQLTEINEETPEAAATRGQTVAKLEGELAKVDGHLAPARAQLDEMLAEQVAQTNLAEQAATPGKVDLEAELATANAPVDPQDSVSQASAQASAERVINLSMASPARLSPKQATALADNPSNGLSTAQRAYLRQFTAARVAENAALGMKGVSQRVFEGSGRDIGLNQHRARITQAVGAGNQQAASMHMAALVRFARDHAAKAKMAQSTLQQYGKGPHVQIIKADGVWQVAPRLYTDKEIQNNGGLTLNSEPLIEAVVAEAHALMSSAREMQAAFDMKFGGKGSTSVAAEPAVNSVTPVDSSQTQAAPAAQPQSSTVEGQTHSTAESTVDSQLDATAELELESESADPSVAAVPVQGAQAAPVASAELAETVDTAPDEVTESTEETPVEGGTLTVMAQPSAEGAPYQKRNLFADFLTQVAAKAGDTTSRPLVAVKDFLTQWLAGRVSVRDFAGVDPKQLTQKQREVLSLFRNRAGAWAPMIQASLRHRTGTSKAGNAQQDFWYRDLMQFLIQTTEGGLDLEENVKTAMAYAAFSWLAENGMRGAEHTPEEINLILNRDEDTVVSDREIALLSHVGTRQNVVVNALGQRAVAALGIKALKGAPPNLITQLESGMGAHIMKMLEADQILDRSTLSGEVFKELTGSTATDESAAFQFVSLARQNGQLNSKAEQIVQASIGSQGILDNLFGVEAGLKEPSFEPIPFTQTTTKNTNQQVPKVLAEIMEQENAVPNFVRQDMWGVLTQLDRDLALEMAGVEEVSDDTTHIAKRKGLQAKNDSLTREFDRFVMYVSDTLLSQEKGLNTPLYFDHTVWKQQRVGIATNVINPQTSKIHRFLLFRKSWETQVDLDNSAHMDNFRLRVLEGLGVKTDKESNTTSLVQFDATTGTPEIQAAVVALRKQQSGQDLTQEDQRAILTGVKSGKEKFHSLDALMALAHYETARATEGATFFRVQMMGEVDGVTNGPMLSHMLYGAAQSVNALFQLLNRGGFYQQGNPHSQYNLWREADGNLDLYETTTQHIMRAVDKLVEADPSLAPILAAVYTITGNLEDSAKKITKDGRNIVKTPLTAMVFGSSVGRAVESMADNFIEAIYDRFEKTAAMTPEQRRAFITQVNLVVPNKIPLSATTQDLLALEFNEQQRKAIKKVFKATLGKGVEATMQRDFAVFNERRVQTTQAAELAFTLYHSAYNALHAQLITELIEREKQAPGTGIPVDGKGRPMHGLSTEQEAELRSRLKALNPVMHTPMSKDSKQLGAGLHISKSARKLSEQAAYESEVAFGTAFADGTKSTKTRGYERSLTSPGVAMSPMSVHSLDSAISHYAAKHLEVLNIHDAHGAGLGTFSQTAHNLNQATWNALLNYSPAQEMSSALERTVNGVSDLLARADTSQEVRQAVAQAIQKFADKAELDPKQAVALTLFNTKGMAAEADTIKLTALSQLASVDQYALEGGNYVVTDTDRDAALEKLGVISSTVSPKTLQRLDTLSSTVDGLLKPAKAAAATDTQGETEVRKEPTPALSLPAVQVMQLLEHAIKDTAIAQAVRDNMVKVREAMWRSKQSFDQALAKTVDRMASANIVATLAERYNRIDPALWGERGTPTIQSDPELVALFNERGGLTAPQLIQVLRRKLGQGSNARMNEFNQRLLAVLAKTVSPDLKVRFVTPATAPSLVLSAPQADRSRGWYVAKGAQEEIYVLSPDFKYSGVDAEVLLHELVHASLAKTIEREMRFRSSDPSYRSDALDLVEELEELLEKSRSYVEANALDGFEEALTDIQEFVAWGMSNQPFQQKVLGKVQMQSFTQGNPLVAGMRAFIERIVGLVFRRQSDADTNGMGILLSNVAGLFNAAAQKPSSVDVVLSQQAPRPQEMSTQRLFDTLVSEDPASVTPSFVGQLRGLLLGIVDNLHGPFGTFKSTIEANPTLGAADVFAAAQQAGTAPFASKVLGSGLKTPAPVAFVLEQVEATVRAALADRTGQTTAAYSELSHLYDEVRARLKPEDFHEGDWAQAHPHEQAEAQALYDFVFAIERGADGRSDYLSRFAALGLAHPRMNQLLQVATARDTRKISDGKTFIDRLNILFEKILNVLNGRLTHTFDGQRADAKLTTLVEQLVGIEQKKRQRPTDRTSLLDPIEKAGRAFAEGLRGKVGDIAQSEFLRKNRFALVRGVSGAVGVVARDQVELVIQGLTDLRNKSFKGRQGVMAGLASNLQGPLVAFQTLLRHAKHSEKERKHIITEVGQAVLKAYANEGADLKLVDKSAITQVFLRTDLGTLLEHGDMVTVQALLDSPTALYKEIKSLENQLAQFPFAHHFYVKSAHVLGYHMATGIVTDAHLLMNARNIAELMGTPHMARVTPAQAQAAEVLIDQLATLRALQHTSAQAKTRARSILAQEMARSDGNGVEMTLRLHKQLQREARDRLFSGSEALMTKGYVPEITNPHTEVRIAKASEGAELEARGWVVSAPVKIDRADPDQEPRSLYVLHDAGLARRLTGTFSITGQHAKGTSRNVPGITGPLTLSAIARAKQTAVAAMFQPSPGFDPSKVAEAHTAPVVNPQGQVVDYRYLMRHSTRDNVLERNNRFEDLLGTIAGSTYDKETAVEQNRKVVQALRDLYQAEHATKPEAFMTVGEVGADPEMRALYRMLPEHTKQAIRDIWGRNEMRVRVDLLDINFGYRKLSIADAFEKDAVDRTRPEDVFVRLVEAAMGKRAARAGHAVRRSERMWEEVVREVKDLLVIKTGTVLLGNILSNVSVLVANGVGTFAMSRHHRVAWKGARDYQKAKAQHTQLQTRLDTGYFAGTTEAEIRREMARLDDAIARNPVRELIEAGLMPTIVEDVVEDDDLYSYKSQLVQRARRFTDKLNPTVVQAGRLLYMAHDTKMYQGLNHLTQLSDFVARYTLYQHLTTRKDNPLSKEVALQEASETFVNYDIPLHRIVQKLDDLGLMMFVKYFINIQRVLLKLMREHPTRVIGMVLLDRWLDLMPLITDSSALARFGNLPFETGALQYPGVLDELATVNYGMELFK